VVLAGAPVRFTLTEPVNPFSPVITTPITNELPGATVADVGVAASVKSAAGGGPEPPLPDELPEPQEISERNEMIDSANKKKLAKSLSK
jgi:hypothetical protein